MLIEALTPLLVKLPTGEIVLKPGRPVEFSDEHGKKLLKKVPDKVRVVQKPDWLAAWREVAAITHGIPPDDPRLKPVLSALDACDIAFLAGDWSAFQLAADAVRQVVARRAKERAS